MRQKGMLFNDNVPVGSFLARESGRDQRISSGKS